MFKFIFIICLANFGLPSFGNEAIIREVKGLLKALPEGDPGRRELTLRLADLYFFSAADLDKKARLAQDHTASLLDKKAGRFRQRSLNLYRKGIKEYKLNEETRIKAEFQLARLFDQLGRSGEALPFWKKSYRQKRVLNIRREAIFKLAEDAQRASRFIEAERLYKEALTLCENDCGFVHYRLGWIYRSQGKIEHALKEIELSLWDNKGQIQEEVLRDYIAFLSQRTGNGSKEIAIVENLMERTGRKGLLRQLAFGFYSSGNNRAGTRALALLTQRNPTLKNQIRLLEEYYALRHWDEFRELYEQIVPKRVTTLKKDEAKKIEKIMRRLAIQLEAEQKQNTEIQEEFLAICDIYLELFPASQIAMKIIHSWLGVEKRPKVKMKKIAYWLGDKRRTLTTKDEMALREERGRLAQEQKAFGILRTEMEHLAKMYKVEEKIKKSKYLMAYSHYQENNLDKALPLFIELVGVDGSSTPGKWAVQAQHLALDIFNQRKEYQKLMAQADLWLNQKAKWPTLGKELADMERIRAQADFENATLAGETPNALSVFFRYCRLGKFIPKSCQNAKRLSIILKDQSTLIAVLEKVGDKKALINEYEVSGHYTKAASLLVKKTPILKKKWSFQEAIKIALLYELENDFAKRDRWLNRLVERYKRNSIPNKDEELLYVTLKDAGKLSVKSLGIKWSKNSRRRLIRFLEENERGNKKTRQEFLAQKESQGELWTYFHLKKICELAERERKVTFYGKNSKRRFRRRLAYIKKLDTYANKVLEQFGQKERIQVIGILRQAYSHLEQEIQSTPMPEGIDEKVQAEIKKSLLAMAKPFSEKTLSYENLLQQELKGMTTQEIPSDFKVLSAQLERPKIKKTKTISDGEKISHLLGQLNQNPFSQETIESLKELYLKKGQTRLASYYNGRLQKIKGEIK
ncbi:MAG: hypothetical protein OXB88_04765 [Bacteriovoracales bacterium]|nr:hypothetical protein [Bacteriovoracales bacterium]